LKNINNLTSPSNYDTLFLAADSALVLRSMWEAAKGLVPPGNPSIWREWNMAHHMTRVLRDLAAYSGVSFTDGQITEIVEQTYLFEEPDK
jgi:hypothetical protein